MSLIKSTTSSLLSSIAPGMANESSTEVTQALGGSSSSVQMTQLGFNAMQDQMDSQKAENAVLRQKLRSKADALLILTQQLDKVRFENEEYRDLARKLQSEKSTLRKQPSSSSTGGGVAMGLTTETALMQIFDVEQLPLMPNHESMDSGSTDQLPFNQLTSFNSRAFRDRTMARKLSELCQENKSLLLERDGIKRNLDEREEDLKLLRSQMKKFKSPAPISGPMAKGLKNSLKKKARGGSSSKSSDGLAADPNMIRQLEMTQMKYSKLKQDLQSLLDEREDLVQERDAYKCKVHRLNHSMSALLKSDSHKYIDLDCVLAENRFLRENLEQVKQEKTLANEMGRKYKQALENSNSSVATTAPNRSGGMEATGNTSVTDEIQSLLNSISFPHPAASAGKLDLKDPKCLQEVCLSLLETLKDRMTQLKQLRRANKQIMSQLQETEQRMLRLKPPSSSGVNNGTESVNEEKEGGVAVPIGEMVLRPSEFLMRGYTEAGVDDDSTASDTLLGSVKLCPAPPPRGVSIHQENLCLSDIENDAAGADSESEEEEISEGTPDDIQLPCHLQELVNKAIGDLEEDQAGRPAIENR